jgi:CheY-like chemotaxis protein
MNGLMVCAAMRAKYKKLIPIVALTQYEGLAKDDCDWLPLEEVIIKPASIIELKEILQRCLPALLKNNPLH